MEKSAEFQYIIGDYIKSEEYCLSMANGDRFDKMIIAYTEYVTAVVEHVFFAEEFKGNSDFGTRSMMEEFNSKRTAAHNKAINSTLGLNNEMFKNGIIFNLELVGKNKIIDLTSEQRREFATFIFKVLAARIFILSDMLEEKNEVIRRDIVSLKLKELEKNYNVHITGVEDDIYKQVIYEKSRRS